MTFLVKAVFVAAALGASAAASADTFDFSYTFGAGQGEVVGSFQGLTTNGGQSVTDISNLQVSLGGTAFGPNALQANSWNPTLGNFDDTTPVTIYSNGALNNFVISDVDAAVNANPDYEFAYVNDATNNIYQSVAVNFVTGQTAIDVPGVASSWQLTDVSAVPVPAALPLLLSGLGLLGFSRRRRTA